MSTFERGNYRWRETYFVLFEQSRRPSLDTVQQTLQRLSDRFLLSNAEADEAGKFESLTLLAPEDCAALDIAYLEGPEVAEQVEQLVEELRHAVESPDDEKKLARLPQCTARFDVMHFQDVEAAADEDEIDEMFDPSALIVVLEALCNLTGGIGVDPQAGSLL